MEKYLVFICHWLLNWPRTSPANFWVCAQRKTAQNSPKTAFFCFVLFWFFSSKIGKRIKQMSIPPYWGDSENLLHWTAPTFPFALNYIHRCFGQEFFVTVRREIPRGEKWHKCKCSGDKWKSLVVERRRWNKFCCNTVCQYLTKVMHANHSI